MLIEMIRYYFKFFDPIRLLRLIIGTQTIRHELNLVKLNLVSTRQICKSILAKEVIELLKKNLGCICNVCLLSNVEGYGTDLHLKGYVNGSPLFIKAKASHDSLKNEYENAVFCASSNEHFVKPIGYYQNEFIEVLVYEYIQGSTLFDLKGTISSKDKTFIKHELFQILDFLKRSHLSHGDISLTNLIYEKKKPQQYVYSSLIISICVSYQ